MTNNNDKTAQFQRPLDTRVHLRPYRVGARLHGLPAGLSGRTLLAEICLAGEWLRLTPEL
jgi:hypothetical protein